KPDQPANHVERILARLEHPTQPVERGIGVAVAQALVQRRNDVVVFLAGAIVQQVLALNRLLDECGRDQSPALLWTRQRRRRLEAIEGDARVAMGDWNQR